MAITTHTITFAACGHTERTQITHGTRAADRDAKIAWVAANLLCPVCLAAKRAADKAEWDAKAEGAATLSDLTGSDKQVAWATEIRTKALAKLETDLDQREGGYRKAARESIAWQPALDALTGETSARVWIDNRSRTLYSQAMETITDWIEWRHFELGESLDSLIEQINTAGVDLSVPSITGRW